MTADSFDNLPYRPCDEVTDERSRRHYWACAIGLQAVDGLRVSDYLREVAKGYIKGTRTLDETGALIRAYHTPGSATFDESSCESLEADPVKWISPVTSGIKSDYLLHGWQGLPYALVKQQNSRPFFMTGASFARSKKAYHYQITSI